MLILSFFFISGSNRKSAKFDEINVLQTYHPPDKDYGWMPINEPSTPFNYLDPALAEQDELDGEILTEKLKVAQETQRRASLHCEESDEELPETDEQRAKRIEFEKRRKLHYNEASAIKLARKLIEEDIEETLLEDEIGEAAGGSIEDSNDELDNDETAIVDDEQAGTSSEKPSQSTDS